MRHDRNALVSSMAADLRRYEATANESDAIRSLFGRGYSMVDIVMLIDDALFEAKQALVSAEMARR